MRFFPKVKRIITSKNFLKAFLFIILISNLGILGIVSADNTTPSSGLQSTDEFSTPFNTASDNNFLSYNKCTKNGDMAAHGLPASIISAANGIFNGADVQSTECNITNAAPSGTSFKNILDKDVYAYFQEHNTNGGLVNIVANANGNLLDQRPVSGVYFIQDKIYALSHSSSIYAACTGANCITDSTPNAPARYYQGTGFDLLKPVQNFWGWSVTIVYSLMILIIIVIAFAIIFRQKLPGNVEVTIQNSIPSIALAMILIPFSYPITGLAIDAITLGTNVVHEALIGKSSPGHAVYDNRSNLYVSSITNTTTNNTIDQKDRGLYPDDTRVNWFNLRDNIDITQQVSQFGGTLHTGSNAGAASNNGIDNFAVFSFVKKILNFFTGKNDSQGTNQFWIGAILNFIVGLLMIYNGIRIFIKLFVKYLLILIMPIFSPFVFATIAIPGNGSKTIMKYLRTLFSCSAAYIVTYLMFLMTMIFTNSSFQNSIPDVRTGTFIPPLLGMADILGDKSSPEFVHLLLSLVGVGIYFSIPGILKQVDAALGVDDKLLKQLLTTPFESIKESANVTFKGAPAATARAAQITAGGARNIASAALTTKYRLNKLSDNLNGRDPKAVGNSEYRLREELTANRQKLLSKLQDPNISTIAKVGIRSQLAGLDAKESLLTVSTKGEEGKSQELEFSILYLDGTGGTSRFTYSTAKIKSLENAFGARQTNITENIAKISLKANNYTLESNVNISIGNIAKRSYTNNLGKTVVTTQEEFDSSDPNIMSKWPPGAEIFLANTTWESTSNGSIATGLSPGTKLSFFSSTSDPDPSNGASRNTNGKSVDIIVTFTIASQADFMRLFGTLDVGLSQYVGGLLTDGIQTKKRAFKIENVETGPFRIVIGKSR